jgi:hypothetical protein
MKSSIFSVSKIYLSSYKVESTESKVRYTKPIDFCTLGSLPLSKTANFSLLFKNPFLERVADEAR